MQRTNSKLVRHGRLGLVLGLMLFGAFSLEARSQDLVASNALAAEAEAQPSAVAVPAAPAAAPAPAAEVPQGAEGPQSLHLMVGRSLVITSPTRIKRVSLADPAIAEVDVITPTQIVINGKIPGGVSLLLWDEQDQSQAFEISVDVDVLTLTQKIHEVFPAEHVQIDTAKDMVVLSGKISSQAVADRILEIVKGATAKVTSMMEVPKVDLGEVLLEVKFAEINRAGLQQLGVNLLSLPGAKTIGTISTQQFSAPILQGQVGSVGGGSTTATAPGATPPSFGLSNLLNIFLYRPDLNLAATIQALQNTNVLQILAEPNLLTTSGKEASFLAGGEFPYPVVQSSGGGSFPTISIQFREFGVRLNFLPTVSPDGTIHLHVHPEVSALDFADALTLQGFVIPAISTRKVESDMDLRDGQTFAIAGLMDNRVTVQLAKMPGISAVPVLGKLFQSRSISKSDDELLIVVTPRIVHPTANPGVPNAMPKFEYPFMTPQASAMPAQTGAAAN
jgi:pilus assembly protein CpaC